MIIKATITVTKQNRAYRKQSCSSITLTALNSSSQPKYNLKSLLASNPSSPPRLQVLQSTPDLDSSRNRASKSNLQFRAPVSFSSCNLREKSSKVPLNLLQSMRVWSTKSSSKSPLELLLRLLRILDKNGVEGMKVKCFLGNCGSGGEAQAYGSSMVTWSHLESERDGEDDGRTKGNGLKCIKFLYL